MSAITIENKGRQAEILLEGSSAIRIDIPEGCRDSFEPIGDFALRWTRKTDKPAEHMKMTLRVQHKPRWFLVPSVNYNGNGWGSGAQYSGYGVDGEPWVYAWHRIAIPACTYSESDRYAVSLFGDQKGGMSASIYEENGETVQELIWPETETPKVLYKRCWEPAFHGTMAPQSEFTGIILL